MIQSIAFRRRAGAVWNRCGAAALAVVCLAATLAIVGSAAGQVPSGFPDVLPTAFAMQDGPPGPQPESVPVAAPQPSQPALAQPMGPMVTEPAVVFGPSMGPPRMISPDAFHPIFRLHQTISDAVGDNGELTTLGGFFPHPSDFGLWFFDGQFDILEDAHNPGQQTLNFEANLGLGWRWLDPSDGQVFGLSVWYDCDRSHPEFVHQVSVGGEILGEFWDLRTNGYFPIGGDREPFSFGSTGPIFFGAEALTGVDMECGRRLPGWLGDSGISAFAGWYYYRDDKSLNSFGGSLRLEAKLSDDLTVDARMTSDPVFKSNIAFGITYMLPAAGKCKTCVQSPDYYRLVQPVQRNRTLVFGNRTTP